MIRLNKNENRNCTRLCLRNYELKPFEYPYGIAECLKKQIAIKNGISIENVSLVNGLDEGLFLFVSLKKKREIKIMVDLPNYSGFLEMLKVFKLNVTYNFQNENYNYKKTIESLKNDMSIGALYISNPRNPFGDYLSNIKEIIDYCSDNKIILFIDEAYIEFYNEKNQMFFY